MSVLQIVLLYVAAPAGLFLLVALLAAGRRRTRRPRYRPGDPWRYEPVWWTANPHGARLRDSAESTVGASKGGADGGW